MSSGKQPAHAAQGTVQAPNHYEETPVSQGDVHLHGRYFTYQTAEGLVAGCNLSVMFTIDRTAKEVWSVLKDFNRWQKGHRYSGVIGDLEGKEFHLSLNPSSVGQKDAVQKDSFRIHYQVVKVIPEYLIVIYQPVPEGKVEPFPGLGRVSPGFHVFMLNEHGGKTVVTIVMNHASLMDDASRTPRITEEEAVGPWRQMTREGLRKWRDDFIPDLKNVIYEGRQK